MESAVVRFEHNMRLSETNDSKVQRQSFSFRNQLPATRANNVLFTQFGTLSVSFLHFPSTLCSSYYRVSLPQSVVFDPNFGDRNFNLIRLDSNSKGKVFESIRFDENFQTCLKIIFKTISQIMFYSLIFFCFAFCCFSVCRWLGFGFPVLSRWVGW